MAKKSLIYITILLFGCINNQNNDAGAKNLIIESKLKTKNFLVKDFIVSVINNYEFNIKQGMECYSSLNIFGDVANECKTYLGVTNSYHVSFGLLGNNLVHCGYYYEQDLDIKEISKIKEGNLIVKENINISYVYNGKKVEEQLNCSFFDIGNFECKGKFYNRILKIREANSSNIFSFSGYFIFKE